MKLKLFLNLCFLALAGATVSAQTIYSNITAGFPGDSGREYGGGSNTYFGTPFTTTGSGNLSTLLLDAGISDPSQPFTFTVGLYTSVSGQPGSLLESWTQAFPLASPPFPPPPATTLTSVSHPFLVASIQYWLVLTQANANQVYLYTNDTGVNGGFWAGNNISALNQSVANMNDPIPGLRLTAVPEVSTWMLLALGAVVCLLAQKRTMSRSAALLEN